MFTKVEMKLRGATTKDEERSSEVQRSGRWLLRPGTRTKGIERREREVFLVCFRSKGWKSNWMEAKAKRGRRLMKMLVSVGE